MVAMNKVVVDKPETERAAPEAPAEELTRAFCRWRNGTAALIN
jgi:hypothetical protein